MNFIKLAPKKNSVQKIQKVSSLHRMHTPGKILFVKTREDRFPSWKFHHCFSFLYFRHLETSLSSCQKLSAFFSNQILYLIKFVQMTAVKQNTQHQPGVICLLLPLHLCTNLTFDLWGHRSPHTLEHFFAESLKIILQTV